MMKKLLGVCALSLSTTLTVPGLEAQTLKLIRIGSTTPSVTTLPSEIAVRKGFFKEEGLDPELITIRGADLTIKALLGGHIDYGTPIASLVAGAMRGFPIKVFGIVIKKTTFVLVSHPSIRSIKDLKGKVLGVGQFGAAADYSLRVALRSGGIDPQHDVTILQLGGSVERIISLKAGTIHATVLVAPFNLQAEKMGFRSLLWLGEVMDLPQGGFGAHEKKLREHPDEPVRVMKAVSRGIQFIKRHKDETIRSMAEWHRVDRSVAEALYPMLTDSLADYGITEDNIIQSAIDMAKFQMRTDKNVPLDEIRDWSFAKKARDELLRASPPR
jgi:NitT/TauT family transport system substrate-binding protein